MKKKTIPNVSPRLHSPFAALLDKRDELPAMIADNRENGPREPDIPRRAIVRYERKGHGGKEMTRVECLGLESEQLPSWLKAIKRAFGCGGVVQDDCLLLQGDQRERLAVWLEQRGVGKITLC